MCCHGNHQQGGYRPPGESPPQGRHRLATAWRQPTALRRAPGQVRRRKQFAPRTDMRTMENRIRQARPHVSQNEELIFERSSPGKLGVDLPPLDVPPVSARNFWAQIRCARKLKASRKYPNWKSSATSLAFPPGITGWIPVCIRSVPAP